MTPTAKDEPSNDQLEAENESLRNELVAERAQLTKQIADTQLQASGGLDDEAIRRLEHPEEFAKSKTDK